MADGIALEGARLVKENLETAVKEPGNIVARGNMLMASSMGATAFLKGLGVTHSCAHALSAVCDLHHGLAIALMLPACMRFNAVTLPDRMKRLEAAVSTDLSFDKWLEAFNAKVGLPARLGDVGVKEEQVARLVEIAVKDMCHGCNVREVSAADFEALFREALYSDAAAGVNGQVFGVRKNEIALYSQPRPIRSVHRSEGWSVRTLQEHGIPALQGSFVPLEDTREVLSWEAI